MQQWKLWKFLEGMVQTPVLKEADRARLLSNRDRLGRGGVSEGDIIIPVNDIRMPDTLRYFLTSGYRTRDHGEEEVVRMWVAGEGGLKRVESVSEDSR